MGRDSPSCLSSRDQGRLDTHAQPVLVDFSLECVAGHEDMAAAVALLVSHARKTFSCRSVQVIALRSQGAIAGARCDRFEQAYPSQQPRDVPVVRSVFAQDVQGWSSTSLRRTSPMACTKAAENIGMPQKEGR
ncbi:MAG TPA: hypothetical protein DD456_06655 [Stenotrophomonas sp.]|nr:hypothetical protein [Stenotrophomonas sp.]